MSSAAKSIDPDRKLVGEEAENEDDEQSANEDGDQIVMRTEITTAIQDTAQPTVEEIKEFEDA